MLGKLINTCHVYTAHVSPALNGSSALQRFKRSNASEIRSGIMFDFYPGLAHIHVIPGAYERSTELCIIIIIITCTLRHDYFNFETNLW